MSISTVLETPLSIPEAIALINTLSFKQVGTGEDPFALVDINTDLMRVLYHLGKDSKWLMHNIYDEGTFDAFPLAKEYGAYSWDGVAFSTDVFFCFANDKGAGITRKYSNPNHVCPLNLHPLTHYKQVHEALLPWFEDMGLRCVSLEEFLQLLKP